MGRIVLCVSKISPAQITRNMILERAGYQVIAIDDPGKAVRIFSASVVDAVVFGDSINGEQRLGLARTFKALNSAMPIVAFSKTSGSQMPTKLIDEQLESLGDPHLLLEALKRVLSQKGDGSAQGDGSVQTAPDNDQDRTRLDGSGSSKASASPAGDGPSAKTTSSNRPGNS
jgi:DNA-binding NtrC family response regulator